MLIGLLRPSEICYNSLTYFMEGINEGLQYYGIQTEWIDKIDAKVMDMKWDAVIGINSSFPAQKLDDGRFIIDVLGWTMFDILVDAPYYHHNVLKEHATNLHVIVLDEGHVEYCKKYYGTFKSVSMACLLGPVNENKKYEDRRFDVLFSGWLPDLYTYKQKVLSECKDEWQQLFFERMLEKSIANPNVSTCDILNSLLQENGISNKDVDFTQLMNYFGVYAEFYLRGYYREKVIRTLVDSGIRVQVIGDGWERLYTERPSNFEINKSMPFTKMAELTSDAKIVLNVMPWFKDGMHDRILSALMNKTVCVTDRSSYIDSHFADDEEMVIYDLSEIDKLPKRILSLLENGEKAMNIASKGKEKALEEYSWIRIVEENILKYLIL